MRVLIIENEIYLAGSIASKLADEGYDCEIAPTVAEALKHENFDFILLSTSLQGQDIYPIIEKFKLSIIILLIAYISNDTVSKPISAGASDYIQKPFIMEELLRKMRHFENYKKMQTKILAYENYIEHNLKKFEIPDFDLKKIKLPIMIKSSKSGIVDKFVYAYSKSINQPFVTTCALNNTSLEKTIVSTNKDTILYICNFQFLKQQEKEKVMQLCVRRRAIISTTDFEQTSPFECLELSSAQSSVGFDGILSIDDYLKSIITNYQEHIPDTELAKRLGISRKSLWEKRKKYDIPKRK